MEKQAGLGFLRTRVGHTCHNLIAVFMLSILSHVYNVRHKHAIRILKRKLALIQLAISILPFAFALTRILISSGPCSMIISMKCHFHSSHPRTSPLLSVPCQSPYWLPCMFTSPVSLVICQMVRVHFSSGY